MYNTVYVVRDKVAQRYGLCFPASNDNDAVRFVLEKLLPQGVGSENYELWRMPYGYDLESGETVTVEKAVVALPASAPKMPVGSGSTEIKRV